MPGSLGPGQLGGISVPSFTPLGGGLGGALGGELGGGPATGHENTLFGSNGDG